MSLCLIAGTKTAIAAAGTFMLAWTHSVEQIEWQEDWRIADGRLVLLEARVKGSGAGMEPPQDAVFDGIWWRYRPERSVPSLVLARSGATSSDWRLCTGGACHDLSALVGREQAPVTLRACP